jgi:hypothetical protein
MRSILIAHRDRAFAEQLAAKLRNAGYRVMFCPGPWPPAQRCIRCDVGYCPLTEGAELMIYDPNLTGLDERGRAYNLAIDSAVAHPDVPMLLAWPPSGAPDLGTLRDIRARAPHVCLGAREMDVLVRQVGGLFTRAVAPQATS